MPTKPTEAEIQAYETRKKALQAEYDNFRYNDAQREQVVEFVGTAMKVMRGEAEFESLKRLLPVSRSRAQSVNSEAYRGGTRYSFDPRFLNEWTSIYVLGNEDTRSPGKVEPYHFQIEFAPSMSIPRERLESLLRLKVAPGRLDEGGNLQREVPAFHDLPLFDGGNFQYSPLKEPAGNFRVVVKLKYLNGDDHNPYAAHLLTRMSITRRYLTPEEIRERDRKKVGHLPRSGEWVAVDGRYVPVFADDELTWAAHEQGVVIDYDVGTVFQKVWLRHPRTGETAWLDASWQRLDYGARG